MPEFDPSALKGRCVIAQGYAQDQKIGPLLDLGGPTIGVVFEAGEGWPVPLGSRVRVRGFVGERADLPVFIPDPNEPIVQGMPVEPGTDLDAARRRFVIERATVLEARPPEQVEAELSAKLGQIVALPGVLWSRNGSWWFRHDGVDLHLEAAGALTFEDHGAARIAHGTLSRRPMPRIDQIGLRAEPERADAFVLRVDRLEAHPGWPVELCPNEQ